MAYTRRPSPSALVLSTILVTALTLVAIVGSAAPATAATMATTGPAPTARGVDIFMGMTGRVVRASSKKITIDFFPSGRTEAKGAKAYDAEITLGLDAAAVITDKQGTRAGKLTVYRAGEVVTVTGHVDPYVHNKRVCTTVNKVLSCTTQREERYRYWIDTISSKGGTCVQSHKIRVEIPWAKNHSLRALICTDGTSAFAHLNRWDGIKSASVRLSFPYQTVDLELVEGKLSTFELSLVPVRGTVIEGTLLYDVADDGRDGYTVNLRRIKL
jgi:hypothetical protein